MKKNRFLCLLLICFVFAVGLTGFCIWKLNTKINQVAAELQGMKNSGNIQRTVIPDLAAHGNGWKITQFGDVQDSQEMCYTITTDSGLIIIDGGYSYEAARLRQIISMYGNSVEAWILTHPHPDHISAFMDIYDDLQDIKIHHIYTTQLPSEELMKQNASWDDYSAYERFHSMNIPLEYVHENDHLSLLGLDFHILSAYSDKVDELSSDLLNDGSLLFKVSGHKESMLFCADVGSKLSDYLIENHKEELPSDYLQMGHHGFGGLNESFYEIVHPRLAFFDAHGELLLNEGDRSARPKAEFMETQGAGIVSFFTAPNQILLQ